MTNELSVAGQTRRFSRKISFFLQKKIYSGRSFSWRMDRWN
jgi:hypothetical protein